MSRSDDGHAAIRVAVGSTAAVAAAALLAVGCGGRVPTPAEIDLAGELPHARRLTETARIDPGTFDGASRLGRGWSRRRHAEGGPDLLVGEGPTATLRFTLYRRRPISLRLPCESEGSVSVGVMAEIAVNGMYVGRREFRDDSGAARTAIPARALRLGDNELELRLAPEKGTKAVAKDGRDARRARIVCRPIEFQGLDPDGPTAEVDHEAAARALRIPYLRGLEFFVIAGHGAELDLGGLAIWGREGASPRLRVGLRFDGEAAGRTVELSTGAPAEELTVAVPGDRPRPVGISLVALPGDGEADRKTSGPPMRPGGLEVLRPIFRPGDGRVGLADDAGGARGPSGDGAPALEAPPRLEQPHVFVYLVDTLRADHLGTYGHSRRTSPRFDEFAGDAVLFRRAVVPSPWTKPSVASLFTGLLPQHHGVHDRADLLPYGEATMAELLRVAGYETAGFITNSTVSHDFRFDLGFYRYRFLPERPTREVHQLSDALNRAVFHWIEGRDSGRPVFAYLHATDPHEPYTPREPYRERLAGEVRDPRLNKGIRVREALADDPDLDLERVRRDMESLYDGEIAFNDHHFGALVRRLRELGLWESSVVVLLSDHGEEFLDHGGWSHGRTLYQEMLHVPLAIKFPEGWGAGRVVDERVSVVDLLPTILELIGIEAPEGIDGRSLIPVIRGAGEVGERGEVAHMGVGEFWLESFSRGRLKVIRHLVPDGSVRRLELYDLSSDPGELHNLVGTRPVTARYLAVLLDKAVDGGAISRSAEEIVMDEELRRRLRALGYLQ